jgi:hypothetical protein
VVFGKKTDPDGEYIKRYLPQLAKYPAKYIYSPWEAPLSVQKAAGCIIGKIVVFNESSTGISGSTSTRRGRRHCQCRKPQYASVVTYSICS